LQFNILFFIRDIKIKFKILQAKKIQFEISSKSNFHTFENEAKTESGSAYNQERETLLIDSSIFSPSIIWCEAEFDCFLWFFSIIMRNGIVDTLFVIIVYSIQQYFVIQRVWSYTILTFGILRGIQLYQASFSQWRGIKIRQNWHTEYLRVQNYVELISLSEGT